MATAILPVREQPAAPGPVLEPMPVGLASTTPAASAALERDFIAGLQAGRRRRLLRQTMLNALGILAFLALWEALPRVMPGVNVLMFPPPSGILEALRDLVSSGELFGHAASSLRRALIGFAMGSAIGVVLGLLCARFWTIRSLVEPLLHGLRSIPVIAMVPLAIIWFGIGEASKLALIAWGTFLPVWVNAYLGARDVPETLLRSAQSLGRRGARLLFGVILPAALPLILAGLRQALGIAFIVMVASELVGAPDGLGQLIAHSYQMFRVDYMFVGLLALGIIGYAIDRLFATAIARLFPWYGRTG